MFKKSFPLYFKLFSYKLPLNQSSKCRKIFTFLLYHSIHTSLWVDDNLGPGNSKGPKGLPNYCRLPTLSLHNLCLEDLTVHGNELSNLRYQ